MGCREQKPFEAERFLGDGVMLGDTVTLGGIVTPEGTVALEDMVNSGDVVMLGEHGAAWGCDDYGTWGHLGTQRYFRT